MPDTAVSLRKRTPEDHYRDRLGVYSDIRDHLPFLREQAASRPGCTVIELGVREGFSTSAFLAGVTQSGGMLHSADLNEPNVPRAWRRLACWRFTRGDSVGPEVMKALPAQCDVLFIDTIHEVARTFGELVAYVPRVRAGGIVLMHDTRWGGDHWSMSQPQPGFPVARALDEFCGSWGLAWEDMDGEFGLGVIRL